MPLSHIGDEGVHNWGGGGEEGVFCQCGVYNGSNPSLFGENFLGLHILLRVRMNYYACG